MPSDFANFRLVGGDRNRFARGSHDCGASGRADQRHVAGCGRGLCLRARISFLQWIHFSRKFLALDRHRATPAERLENGRDFVPTNKWVVFGHHFAAIAGPGPLVGPVLAAQFGYLPGTLWILAGAVFGGCVQDFVILLFSVRRDGKSLTEMAREEIGTRRRLCGLCRGDQHHHHSAWSCGLDRCERAEGESMGYVHHRDDDSHRVADGDLSAQACVPARCLKLRCWDLCWCCWRSGEGSGFRRRRIACGLFHV